MAPKMSAEEHQQVGKLYYKRGEYQKAIEAFTDAIDTISNPNIDILDNRAAAHDKLRDYAAAVKDGRSMIRLDKQDIKVGNENPQGTS
jgi:F-box/TPR repeat protein Pof3